MSEFADTYHLRASEIGEAEALLKRAGLSGYAMPEENGWIMIVAEGEMFRPNQKLISQNQGELLHLVSAEDHGWGFEFYKGPDEAFGYACSWDPSISIERPLAYDQLISCFPQFSDQFSSQELTTVFEPDSYDTMYETGPVDVFANAVGLKFFRWINFELVDTDTRSGEQPVPPELVRVESCSRPIGSQTQGPR